MMERGLPDPSDFCPGCNAIRCRCEPEPPDTDDQDDEEEDD